MTTLGHREFCAVLATWTLAGLGWGTYYGHTEEQAWRVRLGTAVAVRLLRRGAPVPRARLVTWDSVEHGE